MTKSKISKLFNLRSKKVDKPRAYSTRESLELSRIILISNERSKGMVQTTIRIPTELHAKLKELAKKRGLTVNALIIQALWKL